MENIDFERLRNDLIDHFGTLAQFYPAAYMEVSRVERADHDELIQIALKEGFDLNDYVVYSKNMN